MLTKTMNVYIELVGKKTLLQKETKNKNTKALKKIKKTQNWVLQGNYLIS